MIFDLLNLNLPPFDRVALFAIRAELSLVNIGVAIGASSARIREHWLDVAGRAGRRSMHATQRKLRPIVVELRHGTDRLPAHRGVAVLARHIQGAVRTAAVGNRWRLGSDNGTARQQQCDG